MVKDAPNEASVIKKLVEFQWWNKDLDWIKSHASDFSDIENFIKSNCH
jgi:hypothetical protein